MADKPVLVLGATGRTGRVLVEQALQSGLALRVLVRDPNKLAGIGTKAEVIVGNVLNAADVARAVSGSGAVLSTLGRDGKDIRPILDGTSHLIAAMASSGVRRLVCMTSMGAGSTAALAGPLMRAMIAFAGLGASFAAKATQERALLTSGLDVTLAFAGGLRDGDKVGRHTVLPVARTPRPLLLPPTIRRADVADFMLRELREHQWSGQSVCVYA